MLLPSQLSFADEIDSLEGELDIPPIILSPEDIEEQNDVMPAVEIDMSSPEENADSADTDVTLQYVEDVTGDKELYDEEEPNVGPDSDDSIKYAVPTVLPMAFKTSGELVCARGNAYKIDNLGRITINMNDVMVTPASGFIINPEDEENISTTDTALKLGFSAASAAATPLVVYDSQSAIFPNSTTDHQYTLTTNVPVTTDDLAFAFGGQMLNKDIAVNEFMGANAPKDAGTITWTISPNIVNNEKALRYKADYNAANGGKGIMDDVYWYINDGKLTIAPVDGDSGTLVNPGRKGHVEGHNGQFSPWTNSIWSELTVEPGVSIVGDATRAFAVNGYRTEFVDPFGGGGLGGGGLGGGGLGANLVSEYYAPIMPTALNSEGKTVVVDVTNLDTSNVTNMSYMFAGDDGNKLDDGSFDPFRDKYQLSDYDVVIRGLEHIRFDNARIADGLFEYLPVSTLTLSDEPLTTKLQSIKGIFKGCYNLTDVENLSSLDTSHVEDMSMAFAKLPHLQELNISDIDTSNVENMSSLFSGYTGDTITIPNSWNFSKLEDISFMFDKCPNLTSIEYGTAWDTSHVKNMSSLYSKYGYCKGWEHHTPGSEIEESCAWYDIDFLQLGKYDTANVEDMSHLFRCYSGDTLVLPDTFDTSKVQNMSYMFYGCANLSTLDFGSSWSTKSLTNAYRMFKEVARLPKIDCSNWNVEKLENAQEMFCLESNKWSGLETETGYGVLCTEIDLSGWNTNNLKNAGEMFGGHEKVERIPGINHLNVSNATTIRGMFNWCSNLQIEDALEWDTSNVLYMHYMFDQCKSLTSLDLSSWDTSKVKEVSSMFRGCQNLETLALGNKWDMSSLISKPYYMFEECGKFSLDCSNWNIPEALFEGNTTLNCSFNRHAAGVIVPTRTIE